MTAQELKKLVDNFGTAALKAGQSNSGYAINVYGSVDWNRMQNLRETLHREIDEFAKQHAPMSPSTKD